MEFKGVLILYELPLHPHSRLDKMKQGFEHPSILTITSNEGLRGYNKAPVFNKKYLVIFEGVRAFKGNVGFLKFDIMFPVVKCVSRTEVDDAKETCQKANLPFKISFNDFDKATAETMVFELSKCKASKSFCESLVSRVGKSPQRILSAMTVLEDYGYTTGNITKYVDKYIFIRPSDVVASLLGMCKSVAHRKRAATYLHMNRFWYYKYTRKVLLGEVDFLLQVYTDALNGALTRFNLLSYLEEKHVSRYRVSSALDMIELKSVTELMSLRVFLEKASLLEVAMRLT